MHKPENYYKITSFDEKFWYSHKLIFADDVLCTYKHVDESE